MNTNLVSRHSGIPASLSHKIESLITFFNAPLPSYKFSLKDSSEINDLLQISLQEFQLKAQKLSHIALTFQQLLETYISSLNNLESFKLNAEYKIEELELKIEMYQKAEQNHLQRFESLNSYIEDIEKNYDIVISERNLLRQDLALSKHNSKLIQARLEEELKEERSRHLIYKTDNNKKCESLKSELVTRDKLITEMQEKLECFDRKLRFQKEGYERIKNEFEKGKNDYLQIKNKLSGIKLKKENYKELYKELVSYNGSISKRNVGVQTFDEQDDQWEEEVNDLMELEEEQSLASSMNTFNVEITDEFSLGDALSMNKKENTIFVISQKADKTLKVVEVSSISIPSRPRNSLSISKPESTEISKSPHLNSKSARNLRIVKRLLSEESLQNMRIKSMKSSVLLESHSIFSKAINSSQSAKKVRLSIETWNDFIQVNKSHMFQGIIKSENYNLDTNPDSEKLDSENDRQPEEINYADDPIKNYFINLCQSLKLSCSYSKNMTKVPTQKLFNYLVSMHIPLCSWPETIQLYLCQRLNLF